jgi:tight adherence protein C
MRQPFELNLMLLISIFWGLYLMQLTLFVFAGGTRDHRPSEPASIRAKSPLLQLILAVVERIAHVMRPLPMHRSRPKTDLRLRQAGALPGFTADHFYASCLLAALCFALLGWLIDDLAGTSPLLMLLLGILGIWYPGIWLSGRTAQRRLRIFRDLPDMLDILRLAVSAGLDFSSALRVVVQAGTRGPLLDELEIAERDISLGRTRAEALQSMADRLGMNEINSFVLAIKQAEELGAPIAPILQIQSETARQQRWQAAEAVIGKLPMKLLAPLVICIFPSSFLILFTPLILDFVSSGF